MIDYVKTHVYIKRQAVDYSGDLATLALIEENIMSVNSAAARPAAGMMSRCS